MSDDLVTLLAELEEEQAIARVRGRLGAGETAAILGDRQAGPGVVGPTAGATTPAPPSPRSWRWSRRPAPLAEGSSR